MLTGTCACSWLVLREHITDEIKNTQRADKNMRNRMFGTHASNAKAVCILASECRML
jgi:hypothetical protein